MQWFRFYSEFRCDPKLSLMTPHHQWAFIILLCLASDNSERGRIDNLTDEEIAYQIKMPVEDWQTLKAKFKVKGMIDWDESGIRITHWARRQFESDNSTERVRKHREQKRSAAATTKETEVKRFSNVNATPPDTDTDPDSDSDPKIVKNLLESSIPKCPEPNIEPLCSADALRDRVPEEKHLEPEPAKQEAADTVTPLDSQAEEPSSQPKPRTGKKSAAGGKTKTEAQHHPEAFAKFWNDYRDHLKAIDSNVWATQKRPEAIKVWDSLIASGVPLEAILDGTQAWFDLTLRMMKAKGKVYGAPHCCRFLSGRLWESALDDKRSQPAPAFQSPARPQAKRDGQVEITGLLMELRRTVLLPEDWQARTGKQLSTQLGPEDSADYAAFLRQERDRLMSGAIF